MTTDMTAPATKQDIAMLMETIATFYDSTQSRFVTIDERFSRVDERFSRIEERFDEIKGELMAYLDSKQRDMRLHFDFTVENIRHDLRGAHHDDIDNLKIRITRLERHTKLRAA